MAGEGSREAAGEGAYLATGTPMRPAAALCYTNHRCSAVSYPDS